MARKIGTEAFSGLSMNPFHLLIVIGITIGSYFLANSHWSFGKVERPLKHYYPVGLDKFGRDTVYEHIPRFSFYTQQGDQLSVVRKDKIPFSMIITTYQPANASIDLSNALKEVQNTLGGTEDFKIVTVVYDTVLYEADKLQSIAQQLGASSDIWSVVSGDWPEVHLLLNNGMHLGVDKDSLTLRYPDRVVLIDKSGHTRGRYEGTSANFVEEIVSDIQTLRKEYSGELEK